MQREVLSDEPVREEAQTALLLPLAAVQHVLEREGGGELVPGRCRVGEHGAGVGASVHLHPHAHGAGVRTVREEANLARHRGRH